MSFPISYKSEFKFKPVATLQQDISDLILLVEAGLREQNARALVHKIDSVSFKGRFYNLPELYPLLQMISSGLIKISDENGRITITYNLRFTRMLVFACALILVLISLSINEIGYQGGFGALLMVGFCYWAMYYSTTNRFNKFLKKNLQPNVAG